MERALHGKVPRLAPQRRLYASESASTPRNQMDMAVRDGLPRHLSTIHADVEALHIPVRGEDLASNVIEKQIDRPSFRLIEVEVGRRMAARDDQRV